MTAAELWKHGEGGKSALSCESKMEYSAGGEKSRLRRNTTNPNTCNTDGKEKAAPPTGWPEEEEPPYKELNEVGVARREKRKQSSAAAELARKQTLHQTPFACQKTQRSCG